MVEPLDQQRARHASDDDPPLTCERSERTEYRMGRTVPAVERAIRVLELFLDEPGFLSIPQITASLGIHRSRVHQLVRTRLQSGLLAKAAKGPKRYVLGSRMFD